MDDSLDFSTAFKIGPIYFSWYGILITLGFVLFLFFSYFEWRKKGYKYFDFYIIVSGGAIVGLLGARIWYLMFNPSDYQGFVSIFSISSGRSILGSIFFGTIWIYYYVYKHASYIDFRYAFSIFLPNILLAQAIGRWGNFFQQDVYGNVMNNYNFLPQFIQNGMLIDGEYRQPLFLYESIVDLFGWVMITYWLKSSKKLKPGVHGGFYFIWYGLTRSIMELFRNEIFIMKIGNIPTSFILSIIFFIVGIWFVIYYQYLYVKKEIWMKFNYFKKRKQITQNFVLFKLLMFKKISIKKFKQNIKGNKKAYNLYVKSLNKYKIEKFKNTIKEIY